MTEMIDHETGEIIEGYDPTIKDIPMMARRIREGRAEMEKIKKYQAEECQRIVESSQHEISKLEKNEQYWLLKAEGLMRSADEKKLHYPGLGKLWLGASPSKVDDTGYGEMTDDEKIVLQENARRYFRTTTKTTVSPDKKTIKEAIMNGTIIDGFIVRGGHEILKFKEE